MKGVWNTRLQQHVIFEICKLMDGRTDRQTDQHPYTLIAIIHTHIWSRIIF